MLDTLQGFLAQNMNFLLGLTSFISGVCLLYLVMMRTIKKREAERQDIENSV